MAATSRRTADEVLRYRDMGYRAIRAQSGVPGLQSVYGVGRGRMFYEPADASLPSEHDWSTEKYLDHAEAVRKAARCRGLGRAPAALTCITALTPIEAGRLGKSLEPYRLFWIEDPTPAENQEAFRLIRQHTVTPLAVGESFQYGVGLQGPDPEPADRLHPRHRRACRRHHAPAAHRRILRPCTRCARGCHGATDLSPVCMGAALHFDIAIPNFGVQEYMRHTEETDAVFPHAYRFEDGMMVPGDVPGHGVEIDETLAEQVSLPACLSAGEPARSCSGTLWNW